MNVPVLLACIVLTVLPVGQFRLEIKLKGSEGAALVPLEDQLCRLTTEFRKVIEGLHADLVANCAADPIAEFSIPHP